MSPTKGPQATERCSRCGDYHHTMLSAEYCRAYAQRSELEATITTLRARLREVEAERERDFERGYDQGVCEALSTMSAADAEYCRKKFPNWDKAWKAYLASTTKDKT